MQLIGWQLAAMAAVLAVVDALHQPIETGDNVNNGSRR